jgi:peroxiredoxin
MAAGRGLRVFLGTLSVGLVLAVAVIYLRPTGPQLAPDFSLVDLEGQAVRLSGLRGKVVLVNVWTTWCPPCREEMPSMDRLYRALEGEAFELLAVSQDDQGRAAVDGFVREVPVSFPVLLDPERRVGSAYGVWGYPETFVIDREGRIVERVIGPREWDTPEQKQQIRALMASSDAAAPG